MAERLEETGIMQALATLPAWRREGAQIVREVGFRTYLEGVEFVGRVASVAEECGHHPEMQIGWRKVTVRLQTHSAGGLTALDFELAELIERLLP